ncbi:MAG: BamA/TamA family outer membrane protein [Myxococcales bacterium]|nr:BamA/TamA family outer membrane protein [Myxococcales bacterium]
MTMRAFVVLLAIAFVGCGGPPPERRLLGQTRLIDDVTLNGVHRFSKGELLAHLHLGESSWVPLSPDFWFDEALLAVDAQRIESVYRAHGYHAATVTDIEVVPDGDDAVDLVITVDEGEPTLVRTLTFEWPADTTLDPTARPLVEQQAELHVGEPFEVGALNDTLGSLRLALEVWGYPLATVRGAADVNEGARLADVRVALVPGPHAAVGAIDIEGLVGVPGDQVDREVRFAIGQEYSPALVREIEQVIKGMDLFRWATVQPVTEVVDGKVTLRVRVSEAEPQSLRLGGRVAFEATRWEQQLLGGYTHTNLFGELTRLDLNVLAGWAELPDLLDPEAHGPVVTVNPRFTKKGLLEDYLVWTLDPRFDLGIEEGYQYYSPSNRIGVARWLSRHLRAEVSHTLRFVDFFAIADAFDANASLLGRDFRDPYLLSFVELRLDVYLADDVLAPRNGTILGFTYAIAGGALQGDFDYHQATATLRGYWQALSWMQWAARAMTGVIVGYGDAPGAPIDRKFYLGGASSVRGWGSRRLSPRLEECPDDGGACDSIPIGGQTMVQGNFELRLGPVAGFSLVGFVDMGDVQDKELTYVVDEWNYSAGPGLRYDSPVGLFRLDVGFRLNDPGLYDEPMYALYFGLGESF